MDGRLTALKNAEPDLNCIKGTQASNDFLRSPFSVLCSSFSVLRSLFFVLLVILQALTESHFNRILSISFGVDCSEMEMRPGRLDHWRIKE
jgi:hypothetical protein